MARIKGERKRREPGAPSIPERASSMAPGWLPLAVSIIGLGMVLSPDDTTWPLRILGAAFLAGGSFWLGQDRERDPADIRRILSLERALLSMGLLSREDVPRHDERPHGDEPDQPPATAPAVRLDASPRGDAGRGTPDGPRAVPDLDDPLPGEE